MSCVSIVSQTGFPAVLALIGGLVKLFPERLQVSERVSICPSSPAELFLLRCQNRERTPT